jgi:Flp pilus assembly protein TadB
VKPKDVPALEAARAVIEDFERDLTEVEQKALRRSIFRHERRQRTALRRSLLAACGVCGILWAATLLASDAGRRVVTIFWLAIAAILALWVWLSGRREVRERVRARKEIT